MSFSTLQNFVQGTKLLTISSYVCFCYVAKANVLVGHYFLKKLDKNEKVASWIPLLKSSLKERLLIQPLNIQQF